MSTNQTPDTLSLSSVRIRRPVGLFHQLTNRLRTAAHLSRAKRAEELTEPTIDLVVDNHELYVRPNGDQKPKPTVKQPTMERQESRVSGVSSEGVFVNNRYFLSHGRIHFWKNYAYGEGHRYIRVSHDVHIEDVAFVMRRHWRMDSPRIVALIISDVTKLTEWTNGRQIMAFKKGLMKAAKSTNMWIFTNGINLGATRLVGDAVDNEIKESKAFRTSTSSACLNVVGIIREDLLRYTIDGSRVDLQNEGNSSEDQKYELNDNHSHYIVVKDNTVSKTGINLFTLRIIQYLSTAGQISPDKPDDLCSLTTEEIPVVSIVIQGGYDCARLVLDHLKRRNPVVVLRGSGGLADLLAFAYLEMQQRCRDLANNWDAEFVECFLKPQLSHKIVNRFPKLRDNTMARNIFRDRILECVRLANQGGRIYLSALNMHNSCCHLENLSEYLLRALFKSQHSENTSTPDTEILIKDLYLTLDWNCPLVARNEVISRDPSCVLRLEKTMFETALTRPNREEFVDLFLDHGFRLHKFLTPKRLRTLFKRIHGQEFFRSVCWEGVLGHSFGGKLDKDFVDIDLNWLIESVTDLRMFVTSQTLYLNVMGLYPSDAASAERKALTLLTMWAVFGNRQKLAKVLWKHSDQPIHLGLVVSMILERMSWYVGEQNLKTELKDPSKLFADYAIGVLDLCFAQDESRANDVLSEESSDWNRKTAVDIAANARLRAFLGHPCCQKWLTNTFLGNIRLREMSWGFFTISPSIKIILSALLVFPMFFWVRFREDNTTKTEDNEDDKDGGEQEEMTVFGDETSFLPKNLNSSSADPRKSYYSTIIRQRELLIKRQPPLHTMIYEMWNAPITKFWTFQFFYIIYLALFSLAVVWPSCGNYYLDVCICSWTALILVEYIRRTLILYRKYTSVPMVFKCMEIVAIIIFILIYTAGRVFDRRIFSAYTMKVMLAIGLLYFYYRLFAVHLPISPTLGPLLYRLKLMVTVDFVNFMRMALLVICSSGVVIQAITFPDTPVSLEAFTHGFHRAFFTLFITPIEELKANTDCELYKVDSSGTGCQASVYNDTSLECPVTGFWPYVFSIQYYILLKLILMVLLTALFAATASRLSSETDNIWKFQRYILVVDFAHRLPLPAPLCVFCYIYYLFKWIFRLFSCFYCRKRDQIDGNNVLIPISDENEKYFWKQRLSDEDYNFWRHLAEDYFQREESKVEESNVQKKEWEAVQTIAEEIEHEKKVLRQLKGKVGELERLLNQSHVYLESIRHSANKHYATDCVTHFLARHSPYLSTRVQRVPIPDKYVAWEVMWVDYDPVAYTRPKIDFPMDVQQWVDEDILLLQELQLDDIVAKLPILQWNARSVNAAGITIDRQSWICSEEDHHLVYRLENGIPLNPFGRSGLRGRGALPRWGPNHYVTLIITRWQSMKTSSINVLEFVVEKTERRDQLSLPVRFIAGECLYLDLQTLFKSTTNWTQSEDMKTFFNSALVGEESSVKMECVRTGYMDDPLNTDNAWKELELWNIHYTGEECLQDLMQLSQIHWRIVTEDVFTKLPSGEACLMQDLSQKLNPTIL